MTPQQKLKHAILTVVARWSKQPLPEFSADTIDAAYDAADEDYLQDARNEVRSGQVKTGLDAEYSRHYESESVAAKMHDGSWVGWTYWFGGGKHGEPESIDWMDDAYALDCVEKQEMVTVRTFTKPNGAA